MHDGQSLFDTTTSFNHSEWKVDETLSKLMGEGKIAPCIVVGIWNTGMTRRAEYFPQKALENLTETERKEFMPMLEGGPMADNYLQFIVQELKPKIDSSFSTLQDRAHTFIAGSSMGGLISLYAICQYPSVFGGAACLSTHWTGSYKNTDNPIPFAIIGYVETHLPSSKNHKIYFDYGSVSLDSMYKPYQLKVDEIMVRHGYTSQNWMTREFVGESHTEEAWSKRFYIPATFLMHR
jgi:predicted alpha/beta superfamily hydrolase